MSWARPTGALTVDPTQPLTPVFPVQVTLSHCALPAGEGQAYKNVCEDVKCTQEAHNLQQCIFSQG